MSGVQEILVIVLIFLAIFFIPRLGARRSEVSRSPRRRVTGILALSWKYRLAVLTSLLWAAGTAVYFRPWQADILPFVYAGLAPVAVGWGVIWVIAGFRK